MQYLSTIYLHLKIYFAMFQTTIITAMCHNVSGDTFDELG